jgi:hypothetical protein
VNNALNVAGNHPYISKPCDIVKGMEKGSGKVRRVKIKKEER